jgi:hypothetical protein
MFGYLIHLELFSMSYKANFILFFPEKASAASNHFFIKKTFPTDLNLYLYSFLYFPGFIYLPLLFL